MGPIRLREMHEERRSAAIALGARLRHLAELRREQVAVEVPPVVIEDIEPKAEEVEWAGGLVFHHIKCEVAAFYGVSVADLESKAQHQPLVTFRQIAMYLAREMTDFSWTLIGWSLGNRHHTTILSGAKKIKKLLATNKRIESEILTLRHKLEVKYLKGADHDQ